MAPDRTGVDLPALATWLADAMGRPVDGAGMTLSRPTGGGWSNDTLYVDCAEPDVGRVVVRLAPTGPAMFPDYDLGRQCIVLRAVAAGGAVPVPPVLAVDLAGEMLGRPAFAMGFVAGRVPSDDRPSFAEAGFLFAADADGQRRFHVALLDLIAAIHATTLTGPLAEALATDDPSAVTAAVDGLQRIWEFDRGKHWPAGLDTGFELLRRTAPTDPARVLLWGDARPANVIVAADGFDPVALLDWELAGVGPPELDVTWLAEMNRLRMQGSGVPALPGFLDDAAAVRHYEERSGRTLRHLGWYRLFAALRIAVLMHRHLRVMVHSGRLPADHRLLTETVATRRFSELASRVP